MKIKITMANDEKFFVDNDKYTDIEKWIFNNFKNGGKWFRIHVGCSYVLNIDQIVKIEGVVE